jgi:hypothetical protein
MAVLVILLTVALSFTGGYDWTSLDKCQTGQMRKTGKPGQVDDNHPVEGRKALGKLCISLLCMAVLVILLTVALSFTGGYDWTSLDSFYSIHKSTGAWMAHRGSNNIKCRVLVDGVETVQGSPIISARERDC